MTTSTTAASTDTTTTEPIPIVAPLDTTTTTTTQQHVVDGHHFARLELLDDEFYGAGLGQFLLVHDQHDRDGRSSAAS